MAPQKSGSESNFREAATRYGLAIALTVFAVGLRVLLLPLLGDKTPYLPIWPAIAFSAWYCGIGPSILSIIFGWAGVWYRLLPWDGARPAASAADVYGMVGFVVVSGLIVAVGESSRRARSELMAAEHAAKRAAALFETFMENSPASTYLKDEQGRYVYLNRVAMDRFKLASVFGKTDFDLFPKEAAEEFQEHDLKVLEENAPREFTEHTFEADGRHTWLTVKFPVQDGSGRRLLGGNSFDITDREHAQQALREGRQALELRVNQRTEELSRANASLRELSARLLQMRDQEARHLARELHDSVGQLLTVLRMNLALLETESDKLSPAATTAVKQNVEVVQEISREIRTISHLLHPPLLDEAGLRSAIIWFVQEFGERSRIEVTLEIDTSLERLNPELETTIFRIVQECLTNIHRHSGSQTATIRIVQADQQVLVVAEDSGRGIPPEKIDPSSGLRGGVGFRGMAERLRNLGGNLEIHSDATGTVVKANIPLGQRVEGSNAGAASEGAA